MSVIQWIADQYSTRRIQSLAPLTLRPKLTQADMQRKEAPPFYFPEATVIPAVGRLTLRTIAQVQLYVYRDMHASWKSLLRLMDRSRLQPST